jgi:hypothetical protein
MGIVRRDKEILSDIDVICSAACVSLICALVKILCNRLSVLFYTSRNAFPYDCAISFVRKQKGKNPKQTRRIERIDWCCFLKTSISCFISSSLVVIKLILITMT